MKTFAIIGSGRQGTASGYDILKHSSTASLIMVDIDIDIANKAVKTLLNLLPQAKIESKELDISNAKDTKEFLKNIDILISAIPYKYNLELTKISIASRTSMVDLGGNTEIVKKQIALNSEAKKSGVTIVPDCGMGPGMNVSMALLGMEQIDNPKEVLIWDGGLPLSPIPPWKYALFFHIEGLTNEYDGSAHFLKDGNVIDVECFNEREIINFNGEIGDLEAAVTSGGLSTMPWTYKGKLDRLENKTLRYRGHWDSMIAYKNLGLFSRNPIEIDGVSIVPRKFYHYLLNKKLNKGIVEDICIMRVDVHGFKNKKATLVRVESIEKYDKESGFTAMEKWTGWHASIVAQQISKNKISHGSIPIEKALSGKIFYKEAKLRGYDISIKSQIKE